MNRWVRGGLQTAFALALLVLWLRTVSLGDVLNNARVHSWLAVVLMLFLFLVTSLIRARRWLLLLRPLAPVGMVRAFAMNAAAGILNYVLPIRTGDAMRGWWLWRRHRVPPGSALATVVIDKACDLAGVAAVLAVLAIVAATGLISAPRGLLGAAALALALLAAVLGTALLGPRVARSRLARRLLPERIAAGLAGQAFAFRAGAKGLWTPALAGRLAALTAIALLIDSFNFSLLFWAVGVPVPTLKAMAGYPALLHTFLPQLPRWFPFREAVQMAATSLLMPLYAWRFRGVDVILGCNQPSAWIAWWAARLIDVPYIVYLNQPNRLVYPRSIDRETGWVVNADYRLLAAIVLRATKFVAWADRRSVQEADQLLVNGDYIGDIIRGVYRREAIDCPAGCHVAPWGFPLPVNARFSRGLTINGYPLRRPYVLLTDRHYPQTPFDLAIRAIQEVRKRHPKVQLVITGPPTPHTATLKALTAQL